MNVKHPYRLYRFLEVIPATASWTALLIVIVLVFVKPLWMIYFAIIFDVYWLVRVLYFITYLAKSWRRYRIEKNVPWMEKVKAEFPDRWQTLHHAVFIPTLDEPVEVLRHTLDGLKNGVYPADRLIVILAGEEREQDHFHAVAAQLQAEYGEVFETMLVTTHPKDLPGEVAAKGANLHWAGHRFKEFVDEQGWNYDDVVVSAFDSDTVVHPEYFSYLSHAYLSHPNPTRSSYQPLALYNNNLWESPSFTRVVAGSTTFWLLAELARPKPLWTFSSHSMSLTALVDVGFWQNDIVTEDSRIYLQCYVHYDGAYEVTPMYIPVSMDTAHSGSWKDSAKNLYKQQRRWAFGVEHFPYMVWHFWGAKHLGRRRWHLLINLTEGMFSWATAPIIINILGILPLWIASDIDKATVIAQNAPAVLQGVMTVATIGIIVSAILNAFMLPDEIPGNRFVKILIVLLQWILLPIVLVIFGSIPALEAQTRLALGKYLGFYTTKKVRLKSQTS